jgi:hypothetical protein
MRLAIGMILAVAINFGSGASAQTCLDELTSKSDFRDLIKCIKLDLARQIAQELAINHAAALKGEKGEPGQTIVIPSGAVVAFDRPDGCPEGWRADISAAAGRMIVGVDGKDFRLPYIEGKPEYVVGGERTHTLTTEEMPPHRHTITSVPDKDIHDGFGGSSEERGLNPIYDPSILPRPDWSQTQHSEFMSEEGDGLPHNNMPPFIALYLCKKE